MTKNKNKIKKRKFPFRTIFIILIIIIGLGFMFYPFLSNYLYDHRTVSEYKALQSETSNIEEDKKQQYLEEAQAYNKELAAGKIVLHDPFHPEEDEKNLEEYYSKLNFNEAGIMGFISIPCINVNLPIYHGTDTDTLEKGVGHLEATSLPIGGESTHTVLTGHTGLSSAKLFTDLIQMQEGDMIFLDVLNTKLAYQVYSIETVLPEDTSLLYIENGEDLCTLVTCTPYGINDHRLLVHAKRVPYLEADEYVNPERTKEIAEASQWQKQYLKTTIFSVSLTTCIILLLLIRKIITKIRRNPR